MNKTKEREARQPQPRKIAAAIFAEIIFNKKKLENKQFTKLEKSDSALARAIVTTALKHKGEITHWLESFMKKPPPKKAQHLFAVLHIAAAQILFLNVPNYAAINIAVDELKQNNKSKHFANFANAILRKFAGEKDNILNQNINWRAKTNCPKWLWQTLCDDYGEKTATEIAITNMHQPQINIHVKKNIDEWIQKLNGKILFGNVLTLPPCDITQLPEFQNGSWWVQNFSATLPALLFGELKNKLVLELCAAPGGKTIQLANNGANVIAIEKNPTRIKLLQENLTRTKTKAKIIKADILHWQHDELYENILLDAPCSSIGTAHRHPDILWNTTPADIEKQAAYQEKLILAAVDKLKPGGTLIFANCSYAKLEGEKLFEKILKSNKIKIMPIHPSEIFGLSQFITASGTARITPNQNLQLDGFFIARIKKTRP